MLDADILSLNNESGNSNPALKTYFKRGAHHVSHALKEKQKQVENKKKNLAEASTNFTPQRADVNSLPNYSPLTLNKFPESSEKKQLIKEVSPVLHKDSNFKNQLKEEN